MMHLQRGAINNTCISCICPQWAMRLSTGLYTGDIWSSMSLNQSSLSFMVRVLHIPALVCIKPVHVLFFY